MRLYGHQVALYFFHYNFCRVHSSLRVTPAMEAGLTDHVWSLLSCLGRHKIAPLRRRYMDEAKGYPLEFPFLFIAYFECEHCHRPIEMHSRSHVLKTEEDWD